AKEVCPIFENCGSATVAWTSMTSSRSPSFSISAGGRSRFGTHATTRAKRASTRRVMPGYLAQIGVARAGRDERAEEIARIVAPHERLADQRGVGARPRDGGHVGRRL